MASVDMVIPACHPAMDPIRFAAMAHGFVKGEAQGWIEAHVFSGYRRFRGEPRATTLGDLIRVQIWPNGGEAQTFEIRVNNYQRVRVLDGRAQQRRAA